TKPGFIKRERSDLLSVAEIPGRKSWLGVCRFHQDAKRSFYVNPARQTFRCHECGVKGNAIDFKSKYERVAGGSGTEASCPRRLAERVGPGENSLRLFF